MTPPNVESTELTGWKEIAAYLEVDVRTAQRWEDERGLPVTRATGPKGRVVANREDLDRWKKEWTVPKPLWSRIGFLRWYAVAVTGLLLAATGALGRGWVEAFLNREPTHVRFEASEVIVTGSRGRELWRYHFPRPIYLAPQAPVQDFFRIADIDGDGKAEVLVTFHPTNWVGSGEDLYCFTGSGKLLWTYHPGKPIADQDRSYAATYTIKYEVLGGSAEPSKPKIVVSGTHTWGYPGFIAVLDSRGRVVGEYVHSGHLASLEIADLDGDGRQEIIAAGTDNGRQAATLVVLDPENMRGVNAEPADNRDQLRPFAPATEKAVVLFPRTCLGRVEEHARVGGVSFNGQALDVLVFDSVAGDAAGYLIYSLDRKLNVITVVPSDTMRTYHRRQQPGHSLDSELPALRTLEYLTRY